MTNLNTLPVGTELAGDFRIDRVLGAGGFGVTYLAHEIALSRLVTIKEYFPGDFAARLEGADAGPRSQGCAGDYKWGLERFIEEAQTLARFNHPHIVRVYRVFRANNTAYMVLHWEEGSSFKAWLKSLGRAPRQKELDGIVAPLLDALEAVHKAEFLHRDIAPDNIIVRKDGGPVLIDFGAARSDIAAHSKTRTVSALVKPGYSPYEQYSETSRQQGPWTDIYALAATLYHAVCGKRPPDSPSRMIKDEYVSAREVALSSYRDGFLDAIDKALALNIEARPQSVAAWRGPLLAPDPKKSGFLSRMKDKTQRAGTPAEPPAPAAVRTFAGRAPVPPPPDVPAPKGQLLDFVDGLKPQASPAPVVPSPRETGKAKIADAAKSNAKPKRAAAKKVAAVEPPPAGPVVALPKLRSKPPKPAPDVARPKGFIRGLATKALFAAALAGTILLVGSGRVPRFNTIPASTITTGTIERAPAEARIIAQAGTFKAHDGAIEGISYSGDGRLIVTAGADKTLKTFDARWHGLNATFNLDHGEATSLATRNNRAVTSHADGSAVVWDLDAKRQLYVFKRNDASIWQAAFAGSEDQIAAAAHDWTVALWQSSSQSAPVQVLEGHENAVQALATEAQGHWLVTGGADRMVKLWNLETRELKRTYRHNPDFISALAISPDGALIAAASLDGSIRLYSTTSSRMLRSLSNHKTRVTSVAFSPDGEFLASAAEDGSVRVRSLKRSGLYWSMPGEMEHPARTLAFSPDGRTLATGGEDGRVTLWTMPEPKLAER